MKKWISYGVLLLLIPAAVIGGSLLFRDRQYPWICLCVTVLSLLPFFLRFERRTQSTKRLILIAAMVALSVVGRILFTPLPGFKPVSAIVILTGLYFGGEAGFLTGSLSALISNFSFGQGPWTPFQMFGWGVIGLIAGILARPLRKSRILLLIYALLSGVFYSLILDVWTVLWASGSLNFSGYAAAIYAAIPFTAVYALSNAVFLLLLARPIGKNLDRILTKYAI